MENFEESWVDRLLMRHAGCLFPVSLAGLLVCYCLFIKLSGPARTTGHAFLDTLRAGDSARAFALCSPYLQRQIGSEREFKDLLDRGKAGLFKPGFWTHVEGPSVEQFSRVVLESRESGSIVIVRLVFIEGQWRVESLHSLTPRGSFDLPGPKNFP